MAQSTPRPRRHSGPTRLTSKGQVTIPSAVRHEIGLQPGDTINFVREGTRYFVQRATDPEAELVARELGYDSAEALGRAIEDGAAANAEQDLADARSGN